MADLFFTYKTLPSGHYNSDGLYATQAKANTAATDGGSDIEAYSGAVAIPNNWFTGMVWDKDKDEWRKEKITDLSDLVQLKAAAQDTHDQLLAWEAGLNAIAHYYPFATVDKGHDWLNWAHHGVNRVVRSSTWIPQMHRR